jgi:hypothetical protein
MSDTIATIDETIDEETISVEVEVETTGPEFGTANIADILEAVGADEKQAVRALKAERKGKDRDTAKAKLVRVIAGGVDVAQWAANRQVVDGKARFQIGKGNVARLAEADLSDLIKDGDVRGSGVRLDTSDGDLLRTIAAAFFDLAVSAESVSDLKSCCKVARMAEMQAETADNLVSEEEVDAALATVEAAMDDDA